jgi:hypothetical protein
MGKKIAELFANYFPGETEIAIDPSILSKTDYAGLLDIGHPNFSKQKFIGNCEPG